MTRIKAKVKSKSKLKLTKKRTTIEPKKSSEIPVTKGQFDEFRAEVQHSLTSSNLEIKAFRKEFSEKFIGMDARINQLDAKFEAKFNQLDAKFEAKFNQLDAKFEAKFNQLDARIDQLDSKFEAKFAKLEALLHKILLNVEEQNARNKFVLDGYAQLYDRLEENKTDFEKRISNVELQLLKQK